MPMAKWQHLRIKPFVKMKRQVHMQTMAFELTLELSLSTSTILCHDSMSSASSLPLFGLD